LYAVDSGEPVNETQPRPSDGRRSADLSSPRRPPGATSLQARLHQQQTSGSVRRVDAILHDAEDVFVVGPPGGTFQSTTDPDVSICIPPTAVTQTITLTMQVSRSQIIANVP